MVRSSNALYAVGITRAHYLYTIQVFSLDPDTGAVIEKINLPSHTLGYENFHVLVGSNKIDTAVTWLENSKLITVKLTPKLDLIAKTKGFYAE